MPSQSLHITLLDWIAPLVDYGGQDKKVLFEKIKDKYDEALSGIIGDTQPITVSFTEIKVFPSTIIVLGHDDGQFQKIRDKFLEAVELLPGTKLPPNIIHSSIIRFTGEIPIKDVEQFVAQCTVNFTQIIDSFRLVHSTREPMLEFEVLKEYKLAGR